MQDPHVESLVYRLVTPSDLRFAVPEDLEVLGEGFAGVLSDDELCCQMTEHYPTVAEARARVEPFLRRWEISAGLQRGRTDISFEYRDAEVVDRDPPAVSLATITAGASLGDVVSAVVTRRRYPEPPTRFECTPDVDVMWRRLVGYQEGREPLPAMGYFCYTVITSAFGGQLNASRGLRVSRDVLRTLSELTSTRGGSDGARKAKAVNNPLSGTERAWLHAAIPLLIQRVGEVEAGPPDSQVCMSQLPKLEG